MVARLMKDNPVTRVIYGQGDRVELLEPLDSSGDREVSLRAVSAETAVAPHGPVDVGVFTMHRNDCIGRVLSFDSAGVVTRLRTADGC